MMSAEIAEQEADRALAAARLRVREAREEVKRLEAEAAEEARRAKIKQYHAREVSKRSKQLGRTSTSLKTLLDCRVMLTIAIGHDL
jgi:flagellar motor switch/type III secretory pathway protein FliN